MFIVNLEFKKLELEDTHKTRVWNFYAQVLTGVISVIGTLAGVFLTMWFSTGR